MREDLPFGWLSVPFGVDPQAAGPLATALLRTLAAESPAIAHTAESEALATAAITRLPVRADTAARVWHALGPDATGLYADLAVAEPLEDPDGDVGSPFGAVLLQRRYPLDHGSMTLALVAPDEHASPLLLLRAQRTAGGRRLIADVLTDDPGLAGRVLHDVAALVGAALLDEETDPAA